MHSHIINDLLRVLRPLLKDRLKAKEKLERYWQDKVAIVWTTADVHRAANERGVALTQAEAKEVLRHLFDKHDAQYGLKWSDLTDYIEENGLGRKLTRAELNRFIHKDILTKGGR